MSTPEPRRTAIAIAVIAVGLAIFTLSGLCSAVVSWQGVYQLITGTHGDPDAPLGVVFAIWIGGPAMLIGLLIAAIGLRIPKRRRANGSAHDSA